MKLTIPAHKMEVLDKKLVTINKKAIRNGFNPIKAIYGEPFYKEVEWTVRYDVGVFQNAKVKVAYRDVEIDFTDIIKVNGFEFLGLLEKTFEGNIITLTTDNHGLNPWELRTKTDFFCEHCKTHKAYKFLGIVRHIESGATRFVGKSCLSEYIGIDITTIIRMMDYDYFTNAICPDDENNFAGFPYYHCFLDIVSYSFNSMVLNDYNYNDETKNDIYIPFFEHKKISNPISDEMYKAFEQYCIGLEHSYSSFEQNLYLSAKSGMVHDKCFNIVIGGFCNWLKKQKQSEVIAKQNAENKFFGTVGKREEFELVPLEFRSYSSVYGNGYIIKGIQKGTNNKFTWFTSVDTCNCFMERDNSGDMVIVEKPFKVAATIKEHKTDDKYGNSTVLSRVTFK